MPTEWVGVMREGRVFLSDLSMFGNVSAACLHVLASLLGRRKCVRDLGLASSYHAVWTAESLLTT